MRYSASLLPMRVGLDGPAITCIQALENMDSGVWNRAVGLGGSGSSLEDYPCQRNL